MSAPLTKIEKRIRVAGALIIIGLLVEAITLRWSHPTAFLVFLLLGGSLIAIGIVIYLFSLTSAESKSSAG